MTARAANMANTATPTPLPATTTGVNAGSRLASLPEELLANIAVKLGADDIGALRLTCKAIEARTLWEFAKEYFEAKCFMFTSESLRCLVNIASSEKFASHLRHIYIITTSFPSRTLNCSHAKCCCCWQPTLRQREALTDYTRDQENLRQTHGDRALLIEAFEQLPALRALTFVDQLNSLNVTPAGFPYGYNKLMRTTNKTPSFAPVNEATYAEYFAWLSHIWQTVMAAITQSGLNSLTSLETNFKSHLHGISPVSDLRFKPEVLDKLSKAFENLESFSIQMRSQYLRARKQDSEKDLSRAVKYAKSFSSVLQTARRARLSFDYLDNTGSICKAMMASTSISQLSRVSLENLCIEGKTLGAIVCGLTSAEKLTLHAVDLTKGSWVAVLRLIRQMPALDHLHLQFLQQAMQKVFFLPQPEEIEHDNSGFDVDPWASGTSQDEEDWTEEEGSDDELPALIPQDDGDESAPMQGPSDVGGHPVTAGGEGDKKCPDYTGKDYKAPGRDSEQERGYYVCLGSRAEIDAQLPVLIEQCNLGDMFEADMDFGNLFGMAGGMAGGVVTLPVGGGGGLATNLPPGAPASLNALVTQLQAMVGGPPPPLPLSALNNTQQPPVPHVVGAHNPPPANQIPVNQAAAPDSTLTPQAQPGAPAPSNSPETAGTGGVPNSEASNGPPDQWMNETYDNEEDDWVNEVD